MPLISLKIPMEMDEGKKKKLLGSLSQIMAEETHKPVQYVMAVIERAEMSLGRDVSPSAFADVRSIGALSPTVNGAISRRVCELLGNELAIPAARVFLNFTDVPASSWGCDGGLFG